ncbi:hypothetical protein G419_05847 [Rhodococcus triatomae BKS 15-14]|nr:hypothetical protein G419_05847 [Rhodococcus triatomae BKS 15-14]
MLAAALVTASGTVTTIAGRTAPVVTITPARATTVARRVVSRSVVPATAVTAGVVALPATRGVATTASFRIVVSAGSTLSVAVRHNVSFEHKPEQCQ